MKSSTRIALILVALALVPVVVRLQAKIDPQRAQFQPGKGVGSVVTEIGSSPVVLPSQFVAGTVIGLREVVAGLLWVRANDFFHSGNYEAIVPLTRMITWLDPHQIDVYRTGAWHLAYNFVDSASRADRRYLMPAIKFLQEGVENNPGVADLPFDLGFVLYTMKAHDFDNGLYWIKEGANQPDALYYMFRQVAHAYERAGMIDEAIRQWERCMEEGKRDWDKDPKDFRAEDHYRVSKRNLDMTLIRRAMRVDLHKNPVDVGFEAEFKRLSPRVFQISGTANLPDGARIDVWLVDKDYEEPELDAYAWDVDPNVTAIVNIGIHGIYVEDGRFERRYDLTKDTRHYPFAKDEYTLILSFNPLATAAHIQDRTGWHGEGMTDRKYLDTSVPGLRMIKKTFHLTRRDIL